MKSGKTLAVNRRARFDYEILETIEAGLSLIGSEMKSIREGGANLSGAYSRSENGEMWLMNAHIARYSASGFNDYEPDRPRKLLLRKTQIGRLSKEVSEKGLTIVALRLYLKGHLAKVEIGLAKGRKRHDKRRAIIERDRTREAREAIRRRT